MPDSRISEEIGKRIFERRKQIGMTQEKLAELADTTPQAISNYERGERELKASIILKISAALNITADYLLTGKSKSFSFVTFSKLSDLEGNELQIVSDIVEKCIELTKK